MPDTSGLPGLLANLLSPAAYPFPVQRVDLIQTHISYLFLTESEVYKVKKPLDLGFLDFRTLTSRRAACEQEVRLNRRLCPEAYLGVVPLLPVRGEGGGLVVGGEGDAPRAVEWAVRMQRVPEDCFLHRRLRAGPLPPDTARRIADRLVRFHAAAATGEAIAPFASVEAIAANWRDNFDQVRPYIGRTIDAATFAEIEAYVGRTLKAEEWLIARRAAEGRCRDGHGDLRAESICLRDGDICIMDCIEFNDRFRYGDVAADLAFLFMDLDRLGHPRLADEIAGRYLARSYDATLPLLLSLYKCNRAFIRGKVRGLEIDQPEVPAAQREEAAATARALFELALSYTQEGQRVPLLVTMTGLVGSGKSHVATALAARLGAVILRSDVVRKELAGMSPGTSARGEQDEGLYTPEHTARTFAALYRRAEAHLRRGHSVVLDAVFGRRTDRERSRRLARKYGARPLLVECVAPDDVLRQRLWEREREEGEPSDATLAIAERLRARYQPVDAAAEAPMVRVDTARPLAEVMEIVLKEAKSP
ncbi:MAG: hypothetical protein EXR43_03340 [Dehalococcoidia bacterium]|nr:hypothetical protein [Dehalococcoidia bacterium]